MSVPSKRTSIRKPSGEGEEGVVVLPLVADVVLLRG
jgi:hypothetical protein